MDLLRVRPRLVGELVEALGISQPGVSKHLRVLREAGLAGVRQDAQRRWYELQHEPLAEVDGWLEAYRDLLEVLAEGTKDIGAMVAGRRMFDIANAWQGHPPGEGPCFIVTHSPPQEWVKEGSPFTFVTEA